MNGSVEVVRYAGWHAGEFFPFGLFLFPLFFLAMFALVRGAFWRGAGAATTIKDRRAMYLAGRRAPAGAMRSRIGIGGSTSPRCVGAVAKARSSRLPRACAPGGGRDRHRPWASSGLRRNGAAVKTILVVEDEMKIARVRDYLVRAGFE